MSVKDLFNSDGKPTEKFATDITKVNINDIPNKILTIPQNFEGLSIVIIPHIIINIASHNINRQDRSFFISDI